MGDLDINEAINAAAKVMEETSTSSKDEESVIQEDHPAKSVSASLASAKNSEPKSSNAEEDELDDDEPLEKEKKPLSVVQQLASGVDVAPSEEGKYPTKKSTPPPPPKSINIPDCHPEIHRTAIERHRQSQMSPYVHQLLTRGEIKLPVLLEDEKSGEIPLIHEMYQPLRRSVYAIIFNLHHQRYNRKQVEDLARANRRKADDCRKQAKVSRPQFVPSLSWDDLELFLFLPESHF